MKFGVLVVHLEENTVSIDELSQRETFLCGTLVYPLLGLRSGYGPGPRMFANRLQTAHRLNPSPNIFEN